MVPSLRLRPETIHVTGRVVIDEEVPRGRVARRHRREGGDEQLKPPEGELYAC